MSQTLIEMIIETIKGIELVVVNGLLLVVLVCHVAKAVVDAVLQGLRRSQASRQKELRCSHRVASSFPRFDTALKHLDVGKALLTVFGCLTGSARFGGSGSIEDDFLGLGQ